MKKFKNSQIQRENHVQSDSFRIFSTESSLPLYFLLLSGLSKTCLFEFRYDKCTQIIFFSCNVIAWYHPTSNEQCSSDTRGIDDFTPVFNFWNTSLKTNWKLNFQVIQFWNDLIFKWLSFQIPNKTLFFILTNLRPFDPNVYIPRIQHEIKGAC